jgi:hypothetical protein
MMDNWSSYPGEATVYSANPAPGSNDPVLDLCEVNSGQQQALLQHGETWYKTDKFLIQIKGPWVVGRTTTATTAPKVTTTSMQKLLNCKFQKPNAYVLPPPNIQPRCHQILDSWIQKWHQRQSCQCIGFRGTFWFSIGGHSSKRWIPSSLAKRRWPSSAHVLLSTWRLYVMSH